MDSDQRSGWPMIITFGGVPLTEGSAQRETTS